MIAVGIDYAGRQLTHWETAPPECGEGEVLWRVMEVGVCGTDRELAAFHLGYPPPGENRLVIGHEALGQVVATGTGVTGFAAGDWVAPMIRRACGAACEQCRRERRDLCLTGSYRERGILGAHGYFTNMAVDAAGDLVLVPERLAGCGVLIEPLSVVEKAVARALELYPGTPQTALVLGAGPIGILAAWALEARGFEVNVISLEARDSPRAELLQASGIGYNNSQPAAADIVVEAAGTDAAGFAALHKLKPNGVCALLGARTGAGSVPFLDLIVGNRTVFGSVNASPAAFQSAVEDLERLDLTMVSRLLHRLSWRDYHAIVAPPQDAIKVVHVLDNHLH